MVKSLQLQAQWVQRHGSCAFDVTLDCEDGAPVGAEAAHAALVVDVLRQSPAAAGDALARLMRVGVRVHAVDHPAFAQDIGTIVGAAGDLLRYVMLPKVESRADVEQAVRVIDAALPSGVVPLPVHVLIESPGAVSQVFAIAAHPRVQSVSFGLMDFVSAHGGAIPAQAMGVDMLTPLERNLDQFHHPLVLRAKLEIASACHAFGKVPSHCVVTEFRDSAVLQQAVQCARERLGYTRMWSIHPDQIPVIVAAMAPSTDELAQASDIVLAAMAQDWAPISHAGRLHDRASYRYYWQVLERAHQAAQELEPRLRALMD